MRNMNKLELSPENLRQRTTFLRQWRAKLKDQPYLLEKIASMDTILDSDITEIRKSKLSEEQLALLLLQLNEPVDYLPSDSGEMIGQHF